MTTRDSLPGKSSGSIFKNLQKNQRIAVIFLSLLAIAIIIFWIWQIKSQIKDPFTYNAPQTKKQEDSRVPSGSDNASIALLKQTDTDHDGLSDYDEINIYHTSLYLADSDSDGLTDFQEIKNETNANCPQGQNCASSDLIIKSQTTSTLNNYLSSDTNLATTTSINNSDQAALQEILNGEADASTLRKVLITNGIVSKVELDKISDAELLQSYQESLNQENSSTDNSSFSNN